MNAIGYVRVSTAEQADTGLSLSDQRDRIRDYCRLKGWKLVEVFEDPGVSGTKPIGRRPAGAKLLAAAKKDKLVVIAARFDRLFRSVRDAANVIDEFERKGIEVVTIAEGFDMTSPYGRAMAQMASVFAELQVATLKVQIKDALRGKINRGEFVGKVRYGFDLAPDGCHLVKNKAEQKVLRLMRKLRDAGESYGMIVAELKRRGIPTKEKRTWNPATVRYILNRVA
jgi:DNA invertase Pin-like site-specific DNA recombinase